jgi:hypothetical protein
LAPHGDKAKDRELEGVSNVREFYTGLTNYEDKLLEEIYFRPKKLDNYIGFKYTM